MPDHAQSALLDNWHSVLKERGDSIGVIDYANGGSRHTLAQIDAEAIHIEQQLRELPQVAGNTILLELPNGARWLSAYLAIHRCCATIAPIEPGTNLAGNSAGNATAIIDKSSVRPLAVNAQPATDSSNATAHLLQPEIVGNRATTHTAQPTADGSTATTDGTPSTAHPTHLVKLTSGSTGQPQALRFTEANMIADGRNIIASMGLRADSINFATIPFGHSYGLGNLVLPFFLQGTAIACASGILPRIAAAEIASSKATFFPTVPTLLRAFCIAGIESGQLESLQSVISAGSLLPAETARQFYDLCGKRVHNFYGSSETGGICFDASGEATLNGRSIGTPLANVRVDTDEQGRVRVQSDAVCPAIADAQQRVTLEDRATVLETGEIRLEGRGGRMLKIGARRLDMSAWEAQARALPAVEDAFACAGTRPGGEAMLCAAIQTQQPVQALREQLATAFPRWQQPARLLALNAFPQTLRGKTDTAALRTRLASAG